MFDWLLPENHAIALLKKDHDTVKDLFDQFEKAETTPAKEVERMRRVREAIGPDVELFVDANGAYSRKQALAFAHCFAEHQVSWFEEPVSSDDLEGLRLLRDQVKANGAAGILVTHSQAAAATADRVLVLTREGLVPQ